MSVTTRDELQPVGTAVDQVGYHLALVIKAWCGRDPGTYGPASSLSQLWSQTYPNVKYIPDGAMSLLRKIYADFLFGRCPKAHELTVGVLAPGGAVQTVGQLYGWLRPCGQPQFSGAAFGVLAVSPAESSASSRASRSRPKKSGRKSARKGATNNA